MHVSLALDGSAESQKAVEELARLPFSVKPELTIVTAIRESPLDLRTDSNGVAVYQAEKKQADTHIEQAISTLKDRFHPIDQVVKNAHPSKLILEVAKEKNSDLIVLGARGHNAVYRILIGSTAEYVTNHAGCSTLVVRDYQSAGDGWKLLLPCDGSKEAKVAGAQLCALGWPKDTSIRVAMVLERPQLIPETEVYDSEAIEQAEQDLRGLTVNDLDCELKFSVSESLHSGNSLRGMAEKDASDLIFVGATGKSGVERILVGSVSRYLLHHSPCPLWVAREKAWN